ncbi:MAG TPA: hypothetical protein VFZ48_04675 [Candidatus Saccharimonadales bacterium]
MQKYLQKIQQKILRITNASTVESDRAFALPTLIIISTTLMIVSAAVLQGTISIKKSIDNQYYVQIAKEAGEAGIAYANACIAQGYNVFNNAGPLRAGTDCEGVLRDWVYIVDEEFIKSDFYVEIRERADGSTTIVSTGYAFRYTRSGNPYLYHPQEITQALGAQGTRMKTKKTVTSGYSTFVIGMDNNVYAMGTNSSGQLGVGDTTNRSTPTRVPLKDPGGNDITVRDVTPTNSGTYFIGSDNYVYVTGANSYGELGIGNTAQQSTPVRMNLRDPSNNLLTARSVVSDGYSAYIIASDNYLYVVGYNSSGELGIGSTTHQSTPLRMNLRNPSNVLLTARSVVTSSYSIYVIASDNFVYVLGGNGSGQLGIGNTTTQLTPVRMNLRNPSNVAITAREVFVSENAARAFIIGSDNFVYSVGNNAEGELGINSMTNISTPQRMQLRDPSNNAITATSVAMGTSVYITGSDGYLYATGGNASGQLGIGTTTRSLVPVRVNLRDATNTLLKPLKVVSFSSAAYAIASDGNAYAWGGNTYGRLGNGNDTNQLTPVRIQPAGAGGNNQVLDIVMMDYTVYYTNTDYITYGAGDNWYGEIGIGNTSDQFTPQMALMPARPTNDMVYKMYNSVYNTYMIGSDGFAYSAGVNNFGQLGISTTQYRASTPMKVQVKDAGGNLLSARDIMCAGVAWSCYVIAEDGYAYASGNNFVGQLGIGNTTNQFTPTKMIIKDSSNKDVMPVRIVGQGYTDSERGSIYVLGADGHVYVTGRNDFGQLGIGNTTNQATPVRMNLRDPSNNVLTARKIAVSSHSAYILASDNYVYAVGRNNAGQLGIGNSTDQWTPVRMNIRDSGNVALTSIDIAADDAVFYAIASNNQIYGAGYNGVGSLGNGTSTNALTPVQMNLRDPSNNVLTARSIATDGASAYVVASDNYMYVTGYNNRGQLGIGNTTNQLTPVRMNLRNPSNVLLTAIKAGVYGVIGSGFVIASDNYVYSTGRNDYGQLGINSTTDISTPQRVQLRNSSGTSITAKDVMADHVNSFYIGADDRMYATGLNDNGQLGVGDLVNRSVPGLVLMPFVNTPGSKVIF